MTFLRRATDPRYAGLVKEFGRGFSERELEQTAMFYLGWQIPQTLSAKSSFPLPWSHYVHLPFVRNPLAREFYEAEAFRDGSSIRQLDRQKCPIESESSQERLGRHRRAGTGTSPWTRGA
jgi:hypothetical protein